MYRVRFHLARGEHFRHWQIRDMGNGKRSYHDPDDMVLHMVNCKLMNRPNTAKKSYEGAVKSVCARIECEDVDVLYEDRWWGEVVTYNPRVSPHWQRHGKLNVDGCVFRSLVTNGREVHIP